MTINDAELSENIDARIEKVFLEKVSNLNHRLNDKIVMRIATDSEFQEALWVKLNAPDSFLARRVEYEVTNKFFGHWKTKFSIGLLITCGALVLGGTMWGGMKVNSIKESANEAKKEIQLAVSDVNSKRKALDDAFINSKATTEKYNAVVKKTTQDIELSVGAVVKARTDAELRIAKLVEDFEEIIKFKETISSDINVSGSLESSNQSDIDENSKITTYKSPNTKFSGFSFTQYILIFALFGLFMSNVLSWRKLKNLESAIESGEFNASLVGGEE